MIFAGFSDTLLASFLQMVVNCYVVFINITGINSNILFLSSLQLQMRLFDGFSVAIAQYSQKGVFLD